MSDVDNRCDCDCFDEGDWVECKLNPQIFGIVVSESDFGRYYHVQLAVSLEIKAFHAVTLRHVSGVGTNGGAKLPLEDDNVIDFTKERELRKTTTTRGAA